MKQKLTKTQIRWTPSSVRLRLLLGLGVLLVAGLVASSITSAFIIVDFQHSRLTTALKADAQRVTQTLRRGPQRADGEQLSALLGPPFGLVTVNNIGQVLTSTGSGQLAPAQLAREAASATAGRVFTLDISGGHSLSAIRIESPGLLVERRNEPAIQPAALILCVDTSLDLHTEHSLILRLLGIVGLALLLLLSLGLVVVRVGMRPLSRMAHAADIIAAGSLADRLPIRNGRSETDRLATAVNHAFDAQARAETTARSFAADASHELRTPVSVISGWVELYQQGNLDTAATNNAMHHIDAEIGRMRLLVEELGLLARLDAGRPIDSVALDLTDLALNVVEDAQIIYPERSITLNGPKQAITNGDPARLQQVLRNLVGNAVEHTPPATAVKVSIHATTHAVTVAISDNGPGIADMDLPRIFERFWRAETSRSRVYGGSGLGLAIVDAIVRAHNGHVAVESTLGVGTTVTVALASSPSTER